MKNISLFVLFFIFGFSHSVFSQASIPKDLQGFWEFEVEAPGDWNGFNIGENYVEYFYALYQVDSIRNKPSPIIYLSNKEGKKITLEFNDVKNGTGNFKFSPWRESRSCRHFEKDPAIEQLPKPPLDGDVFIINGDTNTQFSFKENKLYLNNDAWKVEWFGRYDVTGEFRALIANKQEHRLLYLTKIGSNLKVVYNGVSEVYAPKHDNEAIYSILGNWYEPITNQWTYGFFEDFAIYDGRFWEYKSLQVIKKKFTLELTDDQGDRINLSVTKTRDSTLSVTSTHAKPITLHKANQYLPHYSTADTSHFKDTEFKSIDTAYLVGYLRNAPEASPFEISVNDMMINKNVEYFGDLDRMGRFTVTIPLLNTAQVFMDWGRASEIAVFEPGETYFFFKDFNTGQTLFSGDNQRFLNEIVQYQPASPLKYNADDYQKDSALKGIEFLDHKRKQLEKANAFTSQYLKRLPSPSEKLHYFAYGFNKFAIGADIMQKRFDLDRNSNERFPESYMQYVTDSLYLNNITPMSLISNNSTFLRDYIQYNDATEHSVGFADTFYEMVLGDEIKISDESLETVRRIVALKKCGLESDETLLANLENTVYPLAHLNKDVIGLRSTEKIFIEQNLTFHNAFFKSKGLKDLYNANAIINYLENTSLSISPVRLNRYLTSIESPFLQQYAFNYNQKVAKISGIDFRYIENLKNTEHLADTEDADKILAEILAPHKGKVIYIDFWGTWCAPCRDEMKFIPAVKEALKNKDVIFIYFANRSPKKSWENFIKENAIEGENVLHYRLPEEQQAIVEKRLGVNAFPTYMLVNKEGEFATITAPRPSQTDLLVKTIENLLE